MRKSLLATAVAAALGVGGLSLALANHAEHGQGK